MATNQNNWTIGVDLDTSKAERSIETIDKKLKRLAETKQDVQLRRKNSMERKNQQLDALRHKANRLGIELSTKGSGTIQQLEMERLALAKQVRKVEQDILDKKRAQAKLKPKVTTSAVETGSPDKVKRLAENKQDVQIRRKNSMERKNQQLDALRHKANRLGIELSTKGSGTIQQLEMERLALAKQVRKVEQDILDKKRAQAKLKPKVTTSAVETGSPDKVKDLKNSLLDLGNASNRGSRGLARFAASARAMLNPITAVIVGIGALITMIPKLTETITELDSVKASMLAASGSAELAAADFEYIRGIAKNLGTDLFASAKGFQRMGTSMRLAGFSSQETRKSFEQLSAATVAFGISSEDTLGTMRALSQIAGKGTVQAEELKGQLGDRLPGAYKIAADAMGITTDELGRQLKAGKIISKDFIPKFTQQLYEVAEASGAIAKGMASIRAEQNRLNTAKVEFAEGISESGGKSIIKDNIALYRSFIDAMAPFARMITTTLTPVIKILTLVLRAGLWTVEIVGNIIEGFAEMLIPMDLISKLWNKLAGEASIFSADVKDVTGDLNLWQRTLLVISGIYDHIYAALLDIKILGKSAFKLEWLPFVGDDIAKFNNERNKVLDAGPSSYRAPAGGTTNNVTVPLEVHGVEDPETLADIFADRVSTVFNFITNSTPHN